MAKNEGLDVVPFEFDADDVPLSRLIDVTTAFLQLLREVDRDAAPDESVRWIVETLSMASPVKLAVRPVVSGTPKAAKPVARRLVRTVNNGIRTVQKRAHRPDHFSDRALEKAKALVEAAVTGNATLKMGPSASVTVNASLIAHVDAILGATVTSIGTIEGTLEAFNVHGHNRYFTVYDALTGERITCHFGHRLEAADIGAAAEKRVAVHGEIIYRDTGEIVRVVAQSFEVFPNEEDLPSADDVRGILEG
jgi:hypothetical protein